MDKMRAFFFYGKDRPLELRETDILTPNPQQVLIKITACALCRTDLHILDGELIPPHLPLILGHQIVGRIFKKGAEVSIFEIGQRVGVPWLGGSCGHCSYCQSEHENLCDHALYTGFGINGGFADYCVADSRYIFSLPPSFDDLHAAPLLCAGLIGYRALKMTEQAKRIGFFGFGASAHLLTQVVNHLGGEVYAFIKRGKDLEAITNKGAIWAGYSDSLPPVPLDAAIIFAPVGALVPHALQCVKKGGIVVCAGIHMDDIPSFAYRLLWEERVIRSVANLTRQDGEEFLKLAASLQLQPDITTYPLDQLPQAITALKLGQVSGSIVIVP